MTKLGPLVTIGIPTFNRAGLLSRTIETVLNQDYEHIEVIISDNASTDATQIVCRSYADADHRLKYFRQEKNFGMAANFGAVLQKASGEFFMWLGDDDRIDPHYISSALQVLTHDSTVALVSGTPRYYRNGIKVADGEIFSLVSVSWQLRVIAFYWRVRDNGHLYGLMRISHARQVPIKVTMGNDWLIVARMAAFGKIIMLREMSLHRELGGASASYCHMVKTCGLPIIQGIFPLVSIAICALSEIISKDSSYRVYPFVQRVSVGIAVFFVLLCKTIAKPFSFKVITSSFVMKLSSRKA